MGKAVINSADALVRLNNLRSFAAKKYGMGSLLSRQLSCEQGAMPNAHNVSRIALIGVKELYYPTNTTFATKSTKSFVKSMITFYHELVHYWTFKRMDANKYDDMYPIVDATIAQQSCRLYSNCNSSVLSHDVCVEGIAVLMAYDYLSNAFDEECAQKLIGDYLHKQRNNKHYVADIRKLKSNARQDIEELFDNAYDESLVVKRVLPIAMTRKEVMFENDLSRLLTLVDSKAFDEFMSRTGTLQDAVVAKYAFKLNSDVLRPTYSGYECFENRLFNVFDFSHDGRTAIDEWKYLAVDFLSDYSDYAVDIG